MYLRFMALKNAIKKKKCIYYAEIKNGWYWKLLLIVFRLFTSKTKKGTKTSLGGQTL